VITANNDLTIHSAIREAGNGTALTKSGEGKLVLTGTNTYSGPTVIVNGALVVSSDNNLGLGPSIEFGGGRLVAAGNFSSGKGLTRTSPFAGTIDTGSFDVSFSGTNGAFITKTGSGTLTLSNANVGNTFLSEGTLILPNATSGRVDLQAGILQVVGTISGLSIRGNSTLDLGGIAASNLVTNSFDIGTNPITGTPPVQLKINFGIGNNQKDLWSITGSFNTSGIAPGSLQFEFTNLGGIAAGIDYPLLTYRFQSPPSSAVFAFAPDTLAAGWSGTFKTTSTTASVNFSSVPEPSSAMLCALSGLGVILYNSRIRQRFHRQQWRHAKTVAVA
jgi:autotransporter-associated beta strand protein